MQIRNRNRWLDGDQTIRSAAHTKATVGKSLVARLPYLFLMTALWMCSRAQAEVRLASVFSDHMVIQRGEPVHVWGWGDAGEKGEVNFRAQTASFTVDDLGRWSVYLPGGAAGGPFDMAIRSNHPLALKDVLVGDVWLASGQSNMQFKMDDRLADGAAEIAAAHFPKIRLMTVTDKFADHPLEDAAVIPWSVCTPETVRSFSAIAYFFGRDLNRSQDVPIGLIDSSWGGTPAEAWTSLGALASDPGLTPVFAARADMMDKLVTGQRTQAMVDRVNPARKAHGEPPLEVPWRPDPNTWAPAALFNAMIAPLTPLPIRGVIWYQGESNTDPLRAPVYAHLFRAMITDWRDKWSRPELPFFFVQLANFKNKDDWPLVREAQRKALVLRGTGMAVAIDLGEADNIHPANKQEVGRRLALLARHQVYRENLEDAGPTLFSATPEGGSMVVRFAHAEGMNAHGGVPKGFEVAGTDGVFHSGEATIVGETVRVRSDQTKDPVAVRYGWANNPSCNLFNRSGLPASPFTSE